MLGGTGICAINISQTTLFQHDPFFTYSLQTPTVPIMAAISENTAANKKHWDEKAATYESDPKWEKPIAQLIAAVKGGRDFIGADWVKDGESDRTVKMIDYACGPGTISRALYPYVTQSRGIDLSPNMVAQYKARARAEGLTPQQMDAFEGNILDDDGAALSDPSLRDADLACVSMAMHHMDDPAKVASRLVERLRPGGVLFVVDMLTHEIPGISGAKHNHHHHGGHGHGHGHDHGHGHGHGHGDHGDGHAKHQTGNGVEEDWEVLPTITHSGFSPEEVKDMFEKAGAGADFAFEVVDSVEMPSPFKPKPIVFFARGTKKAAASL
ncbi:uncharacterized protein PpBr36_09374 [Pyricularia pennisetigena]|uniref:uncharacterized protein n=1 Tax=Pyricularia pennisetigena TaxID=1578925 RepID=UPI00114F215C|nr:uncharacterized protein PpBr36_09374 [Pyricularia pennisetigena]TLS22001.1 hypothetical protein PpBr36_09374 [Pyricularia pennisetigena]